ncbi:PAS domain S-box protein [Telmatospirillum sp. J64-1]|uniref:PAS domain S-box protein n=1 Tax=Telmatospirillum sp. J64-1 TaxID=2502183 RepID=UPI00163D7F59|nr:PAS domain S-box protein [Telmatospirillum sp. J64-1]
MVALKDKLEGMAEWTNLFWGRHQSVGTIARRDLLTCSPSLPLAEAAARMVEAACSSIIVMEDGQPLGIWTERDALRADFDNGKGFERPISEVMSRPLDSVDAGRTVEEVAELFRKSGRRHLLVTAPDGAILGMVTRNDVAMRLGVEAYFALREVGDVATMVPLKVEAGTNVGKLAEALAEAKCEAAIIIREGEPVGIVTERDMVRLVAQRRNDALAGEVVSRPLLCIAASAPLVQAREMMEARGLRHLAVTDEAGALTHVLSLADILTDVEQGYVRLLEHALQERTRSLGEAEDRLTILHRAIDQGAAMVLITDRQGCLKFVNAAFEQVTGWRRDEVLGRNPRLLKSGATPEETYASLWRELAADGVWRGELCNRRKDGSLFWVRATISPVRDESGEVTEYVAVEEDITETKRIGDALRQSESLFRDVIDSTLEGYCALDPKTGEILDCNGAICRMIGREREDILGKRAHDFILPECLPHFQEQLEKVPRTNHRSYELLLLHTDGHTVPVSVNATTRWSETGEVLFSFAFVTDITERRQAEAAASERAALYRQMFETNKAVKLLVDPADGLIVDANDAALDFYGYTREQFGQMKISDITVLSPEQVYSEMDKARREERQKFQFIHRLADGGLRDVEVFSGPIHVAGRTYLYSIIFDVTERHRLARELEGKNKALERSNDDLEQFAYAISHDLKEPLRTVNMYLQLIERRYKGKLDGDGEIFIGFATDGAKRMTRMIEDLLQYSRVNTRGRELVPVDSGEALGAALENLAVSIDDCQAQVVVAGDMPPVMADAAQLVRLFQNLLGNAVKYRHADRTPLIEVSVRREEDGNQWIFAVADNGIGIDPAQNDRIFQVFQRLHPPGQYPGSGIGLAVAKRIVERHGGRIWVNSAPGEGATFFFTLPGA